MKTHNEQLYEDDFVRISLNKDINAIEYAWKNFINFETHTKLLEKIYDFTKEHGCTKNLVDMRSMKVLPNDVQIWVAKNWMPKIVQIGMKNIALIDTESTIARMSLKKVEQILPLKEGDIIYKYFDNIEEARNWLTAR